MIPNMLMFLKLMNLEMVH